jgi:hypothetical protein
VMFTDQRVEVRAIRHLPMLARQGRERVQRQDGFHGPRGKTEISIYLFGRLRGSRGSEGHNNRQESQPYPR